MSFLHCLPVLGRAEASSSYHPYECTLTELLFQGRESF